MATAPPIKFRCFGCNKLLGVSRSKAGSIVACPHCAAELIVPDPSEAPPSPEPVAPGPAPPPSSSGDRTEPAVVPWDVVAPPGPSEAPEPDFPILQLEPLSLRPDPPARLRTALRPRPLPEPERAREPERVPLPRPAPDPPPPEAPEPASVVVELGPTIPPLVIEPPPLRDELAPRVAGHPSREAASRRNDLVLPRTVVVLWSFLVLLAIVFAFAGGLLAGRFLWAPGLGSRSAMVENGGKPAPGGP